MPPSVPFAAPFLLIRIERFLRHTGTTETRFGRDAVNDPRLVQDLRRGRVPGASVRARVEAALRDASGTAA